MTDTPPAHLVDWRGDDWTPDSSTRRPRTPTPASRRRRASARRSRRSGRTRAGVPISAILFGGRRATNVPLVTESFDWRHGVFLGSIMSSETTAAQAGAVGQLRFDPFAMLPFCGYNMGDYFAHWLEIGEGDRARQAARLFWVNWFRKGEDGSFLWPGFGENSRVLKWVLERVDGHAATRSTRRSGGCRRPARIDTGRARHRRRHDGEAGRGRRRAVAPRDPPDRGALPVHRRAPARRAARTNSRELEKRLAD